MVFGGYRCLSGDSTFGLYIKNVPLFDGPRIPVIASVILSIKQFFCSSVGLISSDKSTEYLYINISFGEM